MIWIGTGLLPASQKNSGRNDLNWMAGFAGVLALSPAEASSDEAPPRGDLETGHRFACVLPNTRCGRAVESWRQHT
jgi:NAD(P)H dehydrogenase (quinone)